MTNLDNCILFIDIETEGEQSGAARIIPLPAHSNPVLAVVMHKRYTNNVCSMDLKYHEGAWRFTDDCCSLSESYRVIYWEPYDKKKQSNST